MGVFSGDAFQNAAAPHNVPARQPLARQETRGNFKMR
jgi:hypothetical protein